MLKQTITSRRHGKFVLILILTLTLTTFIKPASPANYPDLAVIKIYLGDGGGAEIAPVAGRRAFLWAVIVNIGDGIAVNFYVDVFWGDQVVRLGSYDLNGSSEEPTQGGRMYIRMPQELLLEVDTYEAKIDVNPDRVWVGYEYLIEWTYSNNVLTKTINVTQTGVSCTIDEEKILAGQPITIMGATDPPTPEAEITLQHAAEGAPWIELDIIKTSGDGAYTYTWTPKTPKTYEVQATWPKGPNHLEEVESLVETLIVQTQTSLTCTVSPERIKADDPVAVTGTLSPSLSGFTIILEYRRPSGTTLKRATWTLPTETYRDEYTPTTTGTWSIQATWRGNANYLESASQTVTFTVEERVQPTPTPSLIPTPTHTPTPIPTLTPTPRPSPTPPTTPTPILTPTPTPTPIQEPEWYDQYGAWIALIVAAIMVIAAYPYVRRRVGPPR